MGLAELVLLAVGLSMDAFAVSICKGLGMKKINLKVAVVLGLFFGAYRTKCVSALGASAQVDAPFSAV